MKKSSSKRRRYYMVYEKDTANPNYTGMYYYSSLWKTVWKFVQLVRKDRDVSKVVSIHQITQ